MRWPRVGGIRLSTLLGFYRWRLRGQPVQELLAAAGIAVGVALVFGVTVANTSIAGSARELVESTVGSAQLQLAARSADGMHAGIERRVASIPHVLHVAPVLRTSGTLIGPSGQRTVQLLGVTPALAALGGERTPETGPRGLRLADGLTLPDSLSAAIGAQPGETVAVRIRGAQDPVLVGATLGEEIIGPLDGSPIAVAPLTLAQNLAGLPDRVSQLLVRTEPKETASVARALKVIAGDRLDVVPADIELDLLATTSQPNNLSTGLFAAISAMVGFLLAVNAMLLTVAERRRWVAELRSQGFSGRQVLITLGFDALVLGLVASVIGVLIGDLLSRTLFSDVPAYLSFAFPVGGERIVTPSAVALAIAGGVLAALGASAIPALDLRSTRPESILERVGAAGEAIDRRTTVGLATLGIGIVLACAVASLLVPALTVVAGVLLAAAALCLVPGTFTVVTAVLGRVTRGLGNSMLPLAVIEVRAAATRSIALASVAALAVYGCVAIQGARTDLVLGLDANFDDFLHTTDIWITTGGDDLTTNSFRPPPGATSAIAALPAVRSVRTFQGGLLDVADRRLWVAARAPDDQALVPASQLLVGDRDTATRRLRRGGWATVSRAVAEEHRLRLGSRFELPTPAGIAHLRVAAITTNLGWPPGAVVLSTRDYRRYWGTRDPSALQVDLVPGASRPAAKRAIARALGTDALRVQTVDERAAQYAALSRQGLRSLRQIAVLLLVAAGVAVAVALSAALWQRRSRLADLKAEGFSHRQLWRCVLHESAILLLVGGALGAALGLLGHALASRWLEIATGFPAPFTVAPAQIVLTVAALAAISLATLAVPGYVATGVQPRTTLRG
jgi:putative ABC transport system permease protein